MFTVCVSLVPDRKYVQFRIIFSLLCRTNGHSAFGFNLDFGKKNETYYHNKKQDLKIAILLKLRNTVL